MGRVCRINRVSHTSRVSGGGVWNPSKLSGVVAWYEAGPLWCYSDDAGTVPSTDGGVVAVWKPRSGAGQFVQTTNGSRPTLRLVSTRWVVRADGVDDRMLNSSFTDSPKLWCIGANRISNTGNFSGISNLLTNNTGSTHCVRTNDDTHYRGHTAGVSNNNGDANDFSAGGTLWVNKVAAAAFVLNTAHVVTSERGTPSAYGGLRLFNQPADDARLWNGDVSGFVGTTSTLSATDRGLLETYIASLQGQLL